MLGYNNYISVVRLNKIYYVFPTNSAGIAYYCFIELLSYEINKYLVKLLMQTFGNAKCRGGIVLV